MSNRPSRATTAHTSPHRIPVGLQVIARAMDPGLDGDALRELLTDADRRAARLLTDPLVTLEHEGPGEELTAFANALGAEQAAETVLAVIPQGAIHDPHSKMTDHAIPWQQAGLFLGLCLGFRLANGLAGKDGEQ